VFGSSNELAKTFTKEDKNGGEHEVEKLENSITEPRRGKKSQGDGRGSETVRLKKYVVRKSAEKRISAKE
jgi:hypothetical protein